VRTPAEWVEADRRYLWHPFTQQLSWRDEEVPLVIDHGAGTNLYDVEGNEYIDGVSSLWCNVHGHRHPAIDAAIRAQLDRMAHSTLLGLTHEPAIELAERLVALAPAGLQRVFYSDSGSAAVEIALTMAVQWWAQRGEPERTAVISLEHGYHGDTLGAASVGGTGRRLLGETWQARMGDGEHLAGLLAEHGRRVAAVIVEPLVHGAGGMRMAPDGYLGRVRELCHRHGVLLICDEVATGFGRTGRMFACEHERVAPDLLCLGQGLTGGYLPLAATLTTEAVYAGFLGGADEDRTFSHGHTFTGNPLACAAGIANLETFERERTLERAPGKIELLERHLERRVAPLPAVAEVRQRGLMVGIELAERGADEPLGQRVAHAARRRGAIIRPLGNVIVLMPAPAMSYEDLRRLVSITAASIEEATAARMLSAA
jgi:adenosylmethionine---8-amino-7-oxononanoate aminotransferase